ncbi:ATP-binding cassette domain-containing protein [Marinoscillum sp. 108]|uniref:ATP-binding cassette domain-containing protein n=1 Tax=Marinoscillum luteum TaxID=861051 RepID=A0ABW7N7V3_9BACT|nr:ABC transporter ATP-binding protein [Marinoscillum sp. 108]VXD11569.1 ABC transporter [Marinoscillum sp. 108]
MIQIDQLSFGYSKQKPLFEQVNLVLPPGNIYGLLGKNGAGKSTLIKMIAGLLYPTQGQIEVAGFQPKDRYPEFLREIYLVAEEFYLPSIRIDRFVKMYSPFYPRFDQERFEGYLSEFQLTQDQKLSALSYGQKKKFLLSFGLATDCKLLILDEPTNGLDIPSKSQFRKVVANAIHEERSFMISTHQVRDMENLIDPIIILDEGQVVFFQDYASVSDKLTFTRQANPPEEKGLIYSESNFGGHIVVKERGSEEETHLSLELLFNAVVSSKEKIRDIFQN